MSIDDTIREIFESINLDHHLPDDVAHVEINHNRVLGLHLVPGLEITATELPDGIEANLRVLAGVKIAKPVHLCFGMLADAGVQRILMHVQLEDGAEISITAHCTFPNAVDVQHLMDADIHIGKGARYTYFERHVHGPSGGVHVVPKAKVFVGEDARFKTEFELIKGRVGKMEIDYETVCQARGVVEMTARVSATKNDTLIIRESAHLAGEGARGLLNTYIAARDQSRAEIYNNLIASAPFARGHVDCKEIVQGEAVALAAPIVEVRNSKAHVTHEAAIGSVDSKQLQTLLSRGLSETEATDLIIEGLLS
ncbi:MAG: SufBD protein [Myxococcales bacterium]|nr:SufBD protein [Myxococcales bacterium]